MWTNLEKVKGSWLSQGRKLFSRSGRKLLSRSTRKQHSIPRRGSCTQHEQSRAEQGLLHLFQEEISYDHMDKACWCFPPATGDMGGHLPSAGAGPRIQSLFSVQHDKRENSREFHLFFHCCTLHSCGCAQPAFRDGSIACPRGSAAPLQAADGQTSPRTPAAS